MIETKTMLGKLVRSGRTWYKPLIIRREKLIEVMPTCGWGGSFQCFNEEEKKRDPLTETEVEKQVDITLILQKAKAMSIAGVTRCTRHILRRVDF